MPDNNLLHPYYYFQDLNVLSMKTQKLDRLGDEIARLGGRTQRRVLAKHEKKLDAEFGSISSANLDRRLEIMATFSHMHKWWAKQGSHVADVSTVADLFEYEINLLIPKLSVDFCPPFYVHFGRAHGLHLAGLRGEHIDGVYIVPTRPPDDFGVPPICLIAVCRRGGNSKPTDKLEKLYHNATAMVIAHIEDDEITITDGEELIVDDPIVDRAFKRALDVYDNWVVKHEQSFKALDVMRSLPSIDEPWDAWAAVARDAATAQADP